MKHRSLAEDIDHILADEAELDGIVTRLAREIDEVYRESEREPVLLCILKGSTVFTGELMKKLKTPMELEFMRVSSYGAGTESTGEIRVLYDIGQESCAGRDILVVEDIIDTGVTLSRLVPYLRGKGARSVRTVTLLDKPERRRVEFEADFSGKRIPDEFVVGFGLDYNERYRQLPYVGVLKREIFDTSEKM